MIRKLLHLLGDDAGALRRMLVILTIGAIVQGIGFVLVLPIIDHLVAGDNAGATRWLVVLGCVLVISSTFIYRSQLSSYLAALTLARRLYRRLGDHLSQLPVGWFDSERIGPVGRITSKGVVDIMGMPAHLVRPLVNALVTPVTVAVVTVLVDWRLGLAVVIALPFLALVYRWSAHLIEVTDLRSDDAAIASANRLVEYARSQPVLRALDQQGAGAARLEHVLRDQHDKDRHQLGQVVLGQIGFAFTVQLSFTALLFIAIALVTGNAVTATKVAVLLVLLVRCVEPLLTAGELGGSLRMARNSLARMTELLDTPVMAEPAEPLQPATPTVRFADVTFGYDPTTPILRNVSFEVPARTVTAIVGSSGSGKTTIARLIGRFWDTDTGTIEVAGADVRRLRTEDLMGQLAFVFQDVYLFDTTIAENIRIARPDATDTELDEAVRLARVDEIVARLPDGLATRVGEGGDMLSGGERQRVSIARALLKNAPIVVLDEATAAIDPENEAALQAAFDTLRTRSTIIVIAHRLQTVATADQILVLDHGGIVERGTHQDLLAADGRYASFWTSRQRAAGWRLTPVANA